MELTDANIASLIEDLAVQSGRMIATTHMAMELDLEKAVERLMRARETIEFRGEPDLKGIRKTLRGVCEFILSELDAYESKNN